MKTIRGIYTNIIESEYTSITGGFRFYFSSEFYKNKFDHNVKRFVEIETLKFKNKYKILINLELYFTFVYYKLIEKRGFYVVDVLTNKELNENLVFGNTILKGVK